MEELDDDIIQLGIDAQQQALSLVHKAISATTTHEKDKIIEEMRHTWKLQENCAQQLNHCNFSMTQMLERLEQKEKKSFDIYQTLESNTSFLSYYDSHPPRAEVKDGMIQSVQDIEADIQKIGPLSSPNLLDQVSSLKHDFGLLKMRDLTFKRLEELAYTLKKRSFVVDDSEDLSLTVATEYGDLNGLLKKHEELMKENIQLKKEEIAFLNDKIVKRRNLSKLSLSSLSNIAIELQNMLQAQDIFGETFLVKPSAILNEDDIQRKSFDDACHVKSNIKFTRAEFSTTIQPETITKIVDAEDPNIQLEALTEVVHQQRQTIDKLISELEPLRAKNYTQIVQAASQREERMWQLLDKFQNQINDIQEKINETTKDCFRLHQNILTTLNQHCFYGQKLGEWMYLYKDLIADETFLEILESSNIQICNTLSSASFSIGLNEMFKQSESDQCFSEYFKTYIKNNTSQFKIQPPPPFDGQDGENGQRSNDSSSNHISTSSSQIFSQYYLPESDSKDPNNNPIMRMHRATKTRGKGPAPRRKKSVMPHQGLPSLLDNQSVNGDDQLKNKAPRNPIENATKEQVLNYLARTYDILSTISNQNTSFHHVISGKLHYALSSLRNTFFEETRFYEADMRSTLSTLQVADDLILRKPKMDAEVLADTQLLTEIEVQTEEEEKGKKGKGKGKPPPKKKK
ncbi:hypothetical protein M9Y10_044188 [Tritrichomonas musculus]|uniref:Uncharacterized protein n=1 Tax=Tritrichomonas musculus TaxID=1915356 RepID=A0ABR2K1R4_9EUKA